MAFDFTLDKYRELCGATVACEYGSLTVASYLGMQNRPGKFIVFRHDVDSRPDKALVMAQIEREYGIRATYYFRFNKSVFRPELMIEISRMGHEVGYHYETLDKAKGHHERAIQIFRHELEQFRAVVEVKTICMHGNPLTKWDNRDLWLNYDFREFGIVGEAYLSFSDIVYLSDTGRTWSPRHKVKDLLPSAARDHVAREDTADVSSTNDVIRLLRSGRREHIYLLAHPGRWSGSMFDWARVLVRDAATDVVKRVLPLGRGSRNGS
jgi:hypothetical protein